MSTRKLTVPPGRVPVLLAFDQAESLRALLYGEEGNDIDAATRQMWERVRRKVEREMARADREPKP